LNFRFSPIEKRGREGNAGNQDDQVIWSLE